MSADTERSQLTAICLKEVAKVGRHRDEIEEHGKEVVRLQASGDIVTGVCQPVLSAYCRVPMEVWEIIFSILCLSVYQYSFQIDFDDTGDRPVLTMPTLLISQVCACWREITRGSSRLWSSLSIDIEITDLSVDISSLLALYFANAKNQPLRIHLARYSDSPPTERELATWEILSQHISRCRTLSVDIETLNDFPEIRGLSFPDLESVSEQLFMDEGAVWFWQAIQKAPKLSQVELWDNRDALPYSQLTSLHFHWVEGSELLLLLNILPTCQSLRRLSLWSLDPIDLSRHVADDQIKAPSSLKELSLVDDHRFPGLNIGVTLGTLLDILSIPSLVSLEVSCFEWPLSLQEMVERSPLLERLTLTISSPSRQDLSMYPLTPFLRSLPNLTSFEVCFGKADTFETGNYCYGDDIFGSQFFDLTWEMKSPSFLPKLESLLFRLSDISLDSELIMTVLRDIREERFSAYSFRPWKSLYILRSLAKEPDVRFVLEPTYVEGVRELEHKYGLKVVIGDYVDVSRSG